MSYVYAVCKWFKGSGIAETLVAARVVVEGSVDHALRGKHDNRGIQYILLWRETLICARLKKVLGQMELSAATRSSLDILRNALTETQEALQKAHSDLQEDDDIKELINKVYGKPGSDMGNIWLSFLEMADPLVQNINACHARNGPEYISPSYSMLSGLMA